MFTCPTPVHKLLQVTRLLPRLKAQHTEKLA
jgi:hypothetical protein